TLLPRFSITLSVTEAVILLERSVLRVAKVLPKDGGVRGRGRTVGSEEWTGGEAEEVGRRWCRGGSATRAFGQTGGFGTASFLGGLWAFCVVVRLVGEG